MNKILLGILSILWLTAGTVGAAPAVTGSTGQINIPSADALREGQLSLGYYQLKHGSVSVLNAPLAKNFEIGVSALHENHKEDKTLLQAKFVLAPETVLTPGYAIGVYDATNLERRSMYAVMSKALPFGFRIHVGVGNGRYDGVFASLEKTINPPSMRKGKNKFPMTTLIAEFDGRTMNYGARVSIAPQLKADIGWREHTAYVGLSFTK